MLSGIRFDEREEDLTTRIERIDRIGDYYTVEAAARELKVTKKSALYRIWRYGVPVKRVGHTDLVRLEDLREAYLVAQ